MPILPANPSSVAFSNIQVLPSGTQPYVQQMNFGQMIGEILFWNPDCAAYAPVLINTALRVVLDRRTWFGLFIKGQIIAPQATTQGSATVTLGSKTVVGTNTAWTTALVGQQFRIGYNNPIYSIIAVDPVGQTLELELPWGSTSVTSGYFIVQYYYNFGPNIKYIKTMVNMQLGYKFRLHLTQDYLNSLDPWRQNQNFPWGASPMPLAPDGSYLMELYPASWIQQAFPFMAYIQPPNLVNDSDTLPAYIRTDVVVKHAIAQALVWRGPKQNPYYDANESARKMAEFEGELQQMAMADENLYRINLTFPGEDLSFYAPGGSLWAASHAITAADSGAYGDF